MTMIHSQDVHTQIQTQLRQADTLPAALSHHFLAPQAEVLAPILAQLNSAPFDKGEVSAMARGIVREVRQRAGAGVSLDTFLREYSLDSHEGIMLMCLAEALIRIPDDSTARLLVEDKLSDADFALHLGRSDSLFVNASTWGLLLTGRLFDGAAEALDQGSMRRLFQRLGTNVALSAIRQAMTLVGEQFVVSETIADALARVKAAPDHIRYSFDMLGEAAVCEEDAARYGQAYLDAIEAVGALRAGRRLSVSIKLSALEARYEPMQAVHAEQRLMARLEQLVQAARDLDVQLTIDAEEAYRLHSSLRLFARLYHAPLTKGWPGLGLALQAYQKRALPVLDWLAQQAAAVGDRIPVRLVKGAYWDTEIKRAQVLGLEDYPVFVHKAATDCSWLACADRLLNQDNLLYGQFASHNAHSLTALMAMARHHGTHEFELQRLYGMGSVLPEVLAEHFPQVPQRIYAPVGSHQALLPYLMRRLLENGANSSFVHHLSNPDYPIDTMVRDPRDSLRDEQAANLAIALPGALYLPERHNSSGINLDDEACLRRTLDQLWRSRPHNLQCQPLVAGRSVPVENRMAVVSPADTAMVLGEVGFAGEAACELALHQAHGASDDWRRTPVAFRAACLERMADLLEAERERLMSLAMFEAGKTLLPALNEVREAVDFCRYYATLARHQLQTAVTLPGPTGEQNRLWLEGRGAFLTISPWNFPLAIFTGQVAAAQVAGNTVVAKPSELTPLCAQAIVQLFYQAGIPEEVLSLLPASGEVTAHHLVPDPRLAGIAFTGSTAAARSIARALAAREGPFIPLIAETGGQNCLFVDSSALPEQVVKDVLASAFDSGGQRCSALRVLYLQQEIADEVLALLAGALRLLRVGHPLDPASDVGPVINQGARQKLTEYVNRLRSRADVRCIAEARLDATASTGHFVAPVIVELPGITPPDEEVFGPVLHVLRFRADQFEAALEAAAASGHALTGGLHSRIASRHQLLEHKLPLGNFYVNRNIIGAVVGTQPFGGFGLSGTGPKAGGPHYLLPFCRERCTTVNTAAVGGDVSLLSGNSGTQGVLPE